MSIETNCRLFLRATTWIKLKTETSDPAAGLALVVGFSQRSRQPHFGLVPHLLPPDENAAKLQAGRFHIPPYHHVVTYSSKLELRQHCNDGRDPVLLPPVGYSSRHLSIASIYSWWSKTVETPNDSLDSNGLENSSSHYK